MRILCIDNSYQLISTTSVHYTTDYKGARFSLPLESEYTVYAIWIRDSEVLYCILEDERDGYPKWYPSVLFRVTDGRMPSCWRFDLNIGLDIKASNFLITFPDWINDPLFNGNLVDGDPSTREVWERYRRLIADDSTP